MNLTGVDVKPYGLSENLFWRIVDWCADRGATDFGVCFIGTNGYALAQAAKERLRLDLDTHFLGEFRRRVPMLLGWDEAEIAVYSLDAYSLSFLRDLGIEIPMEIDRDAYLESVREYETREAARPTWPDSRIVLSSALAPVKPTFPAETFQMYLCVYRDGVPMLGIFCEEYPELLLVLSDDDLDSFRQLNLTLELDLIPNYWQS